MPGGGGYYSGGGRTRPGNQTPSAGVPGRSRYPQPAPNEADRINAELSREQYEDYQKRYQPIEKEYIREISDPAFVERGVEDTRQRVQQAEQVNRGITNRAISRSGLNVTPAQEQALDRLRKMGEAKNMTYGIQTARDSYSDLQLDALNTATGYGRGIAKSATDIYGNLAEQGARRDAANRVADAQQDAAQTNTLLTIGTMIWAFSSREYKENIHPSDTEKLHELIMSIRVNNFDYREDAPASVAGESGFIGPVTEQLPPEFVSNNGKQVNLYNVIFSLVASNQQLAQRVAQLESTMEA
jgi:hypothetical protein